MAENKLVFHEAVELDYNDAYAWYENKQEGLKERFLAAVRGKLSEIVAHPEYYSESFKKGYREALQVRNPVNVYQC